TVDTYARKRCCRSAAVSGNAVGRPVGDGLGPAAGDALGPAVGVGAGVGVGTGVAAGVGGAASGPLAAAADGAALSAATRTAATSTTATGAPAATHGHLPRQARVSEASGVRHIRAGGGASGCRGDFGARICGFSWNRRVGEHHWAPAQSS